MKSRYLFSFMLLLFATVLISCKDDEKASIELDKSSLTMDVRGGGELIKLTASGEWKIYDIPEWLSINPVSGDYSAEITITATENEGFTRRKASLLFTCGEDSKTLEVEQLSLEDLAPFIKLDKNDQSMSLWGSTEKIKITTNSTWEVVNVPDWITVTPKSGEKSAEITIIAKENRMPERREVDITIRSGEVKKILNINQPGLKDAIRMPLLSIFSYKEVELSDFYTAKTYSLFVNPTIQERVYLGNLISHNMQSHIDIPLFTGYTFNPVTVSTSAPISGDVARTYVPSWENQDAFARQIISENPKQNVSFVTDNGTTDFYSYGELYTIGMANIGVELDKVVSGLSYKEKEMTKKYGMVYAFKQILFSLNMDYPEKLIKEELKEADRSKGVSYVHSVNYGKIGLMVVESDTDSRDVRIAINRMLAGETLSQHETQLIQSADISYVYFTNKNEVQVKKGNLDAVNAYQDAVTKEKDNIYPVTFQLADFANHSRSTISFSFKMPD